MRTTWAMISAGMARNILQILCNAKSSLCTKHGMTFYKELEVSGGFSDCSWHKLMEYLLKGMVTCLKLFSFCFF